MPWDTERRVARPEVPAEGRWRLLGAVTVLGHRSHRAMVAALSLYNPSGCSCGLVDPADASACGTHLQAFSRRRMPWFQEMEASRRSSAVGTVCRVQTEHTALSQPHALHSHAKQGGKDSALFIYSLRTNVVRISKGKGHTSVIALGRGWLACSKGKQRIYLMQWVSCAALHPWGKPSLSGSNKNK